MYFFLNEGRVIATIASSQEEGSMASIKEVIRGVITEIIMCYQRIKERQILFQFAKSFEQ